MPAKIVSSEELLRRAQTARQAGQTIVHCHGCFDIVHPGHVRYLEFAKRQGDLLVVSLTGDQQINKGAQRPYIPQELRAENLAALEMVDLVYIDPHPTAAELLNQLQPEIYVKGREYESSTDPGFLAERAIVAGYGGRVLFSSGDVVFSSSRLIEALGRETDMEAQRLALYCRRYDLTTAACHDLLGAFAGLNVLVVGDLIIDRYVLCDATELASEAAMMSLARQEERLFVGGAAMVARHVAGLGANACLLSAAARDELSATAAGVLEGESVRACLVPCRPRLPEKTRFLVDTSKLFRVEDAASHPLDSLAEREAAAWVSTLSGELDAVIYCDFGCGTVTGGLLGRIAAAMNGRRPIVAADASGSRGKLLQFLGADLLCPTERALRSCQHDFDRGLSSVAWNALDQTRARQMIVTLGKKGVVAFDRQTQDTNSPDWRGRLRSEYLPSLAEPVVDPLGGGDALLAVATLTLAAGGSLMQAAYLGTAAAAVEVGRFGNVPLDLPAMRRWLSGRVELPRDDGPRTHTPGRARHSAAADASPVGM